MKKKMAELNVVKNEFSREIKQMVASFIGRLVAFLGIINAFDAIAIKWILLQLQRR